MDYPISLPSSPGVRNATWTPTSVVAVFTSPFTAKQQTQEHPGQLWQVRFEIPRMTDDVAGEWIAALLSLNGRKGTFLFGDPARRSLLGVGSGGLVDGADQTGTSLATKGWPVSTANILKRADWIQLGGSAQTPFTGVPTWPTAIYTTEYGASTIKVNFDTACPVGGGILNWGMGDVYDRESIPAGAISVVLTHNLGNLTARLYRVIANVDSDASGNATVPIWPMLRESPGDGESLILSDAKGTFRLKDNVMAWDTDFLKRSAVEIEAMEAI